MCGLQHSSSVWIKYLASYRIPCCPCKSWETFKNQWWPHLKSKTTCRNCLYIKPYLCTNWLFVWCRRWHWRTKRSARPETAAPEPRLQCYTLEDKHKLTINTLNRQTSKESKSDELSKSACCLEFPSARLNNKQKRWNIFIMRHGRRAGDKQTCNRMLQRHGTIPIPDL